MKGARPERLMLTETPVSITCHCSNLIKFKFMQPRSGDREEGTAPWRNDLLHSQKRILDILKKQRSAGVIKPKVHSEQLISIVREI